MHIVGIAAYDGVIPFDLATPCEVFGRVRVRDDCAPYQVRVCGVTRTVDAGSFVMRTRWGMRALAHSDTVFVPGMADPGRPLPPALLRAVRAAAANGSRVASICSGAFVLAAAGLLEGRRATTHWLAAAELARRYPAVTVDPDVLYIDNGNVLTSAGAAAGLDLCLHLIRRDHGAAVAADAARRSVMPLERDGGQAQFIVHQPPTADSQSLEPLLRWLEDHPTKTLTLASMARQARMSERTFSRQFRAQTGTTPAHWVLRMRVRRAQFLLETSAHSVEQIASEAGFGSAATFRDRFRRFVGTSPQAYRLAFRGKR